MQLSAIEITERTLEVVGSEFKHVYTIFGSSRL